MFAKLLALGTSRFIGLTSPGVVTLTSALPQEQTTWEITDPVQTGTSSLITGTPVTIKSINNPRELLEWFTAGGGGVRTTTSIIPTATTKFLIQMPGSSAGTIIPHGANVTLSSKPAAATGTGVLGFIAAVVRAFVSLFTGTPPAWYLSATATGLTLARLPTPGSAETFTIFQAPLISEFTIRPVPIPFGRTSVSTAELSFLSSMPPGGATIDFRIRSGSRFTSNFPAQITVPAGVRSHSEQLPLKWDFRSCEELSIDASTVSAFQRSRSKVFIANFIEPCPYFSMKVTPEVIEVSDPPTPTAVSVDFTYDTSSWPSTADNLEINLSGASSGVVLSTPSWTISKAMPAPTTFTFHVTPAPKQDCVAIKITFRFTTNAGVEVKTTPNTDGIVVLTKPA